MWGEGPRWIGVNSRTFGKGVSLALLDLIKKNNGITAVPSSLLRALSHYA